MPPVLFHTMWWMVQLPAPEIPTIGLLRVMLPVEPKKWASPKLKTPPSAAVSQ